MSQKIGIMDEGYFVSRTDIIRWVNHILQLDITHIEQLGTGAIYCQLLDSLYPGRVLTTKINWRAKHQYEFIQNFKLLQGVLDRLGIDRKIEVEKLVKCKCQDNLQMIQWMKRFIELQGGTQEGYNPQARRGNVVIELPQPNNRRRDSNKQNTKKLSMSTSNLLLKSYAAYSTTTGKSSARRSQSPDLNLTLITPNKSIVQEQRIVSKTQRNPLRSLRYEDSNKLQQIKAILKQSKQQKQQLKDIKRILASEDIQEEDELDFI